MKKTNFFKLLMVGAVTLSLGLAACNNVSEKDFEALCKRVDANELSIAQLTTTLNAIDAGNWVTNVTKNSDGNLLITYRTGEPTIVELGPSGDPGVGFVKLGSNGNWFIEDKDTGIPAVGPSPKIEDGKWLFPKLDADNKVVWEAGDPALLSAYAKEANGVWTLYIPDADNAGKFAEIKLPAAGSDITNMTILGWITGKGAANENISLYSDVAAGGGAGVDAVQADGMPVGYAWITKFYTEKTDQTDSYKGTGGEAILNAGEKDEFAWNGGDFKVVKDQVLNTLEASRTGILVQVFPATAQVQDIKNFVLQTSKKDGVLPIRFGTPELVTGLLTRAAESSALYFVPGAQYLTEGGEPVKFVTGGGKTGAQKYTELFVDNALYTLVWGNQRSSYSLFDVDPAAATSIESAVQGVKVGDKVITATAGVAGSQAYTDGFTTEYVIERGTEYTLDFKKAPLNETVVDYTIEMYDKSGDNWFQKQFDVKFNEKNNAFTVNRLPDNVSLAVFELLVKKLGIDGRIYLERIVIHPIRVSATTTIPLGDYKITDAVKDNATDYLSGVMKTADLAPMFTDLAAQNDHAVEFTNLSERWRNQEKGARNLVLKSVKVGDDDALTTTSTPTIDAQMKIWFGSAAVYQGAASAITVPKLYKNAEGTGNNNVTTNLWEAKSFVYQPYYAYMPAATLLPTFAVNEEIVLTYDITDKDNQYLNTLVITVKPVIPALTTMIKKDLDFWSDDETVLNAYYRDPANYFKTDMPAWYDIALGAYANDAAENVGGSGGFEKIGGAQGTDNEWANLTFSLSGDDKDGNYVYMNNSIGYATKVASQGAISTTGTYPGPVGYAGIAESVDNKMFGLYYQNSIDLTTDGTAAVAKPNGWKDAYGKELNVIAQAVYLGVYEYKDADDKWLTDANFKIKIMSALFEGEVVAIRNGVEVPAISIPASGAGFAKLTDADITGITYNDVKYSLFEVYDAAITGNRKYMYTYIKQVKFKVAGDNKYFIKAADGVTDTEDAVAPVAATDTNDGKSYVNIKSGNPTQNVETTIGVEVTDRFGKTLKATVPLNITRAE